MGAKKAVTEVTVYAGAEGIARLVTGSTVFIEQARGPSYFGEAGERLPFWNLTAGTNRTPLAQAETAEALARWAKRNGAKRAVTL